jgi:hypothetical protein
MLQKHVNIRPEHQQLTRPKPELSDSNQGITARVKADGWVTGLRKELQMGSHVRARFHK